MNSTTPMPIEAGHDGWLFLTRGEYGTIDLYREQSAFTPQMAVQWVELLRERGDRLEALGIDYLHVSAPDKLTLLNRHYGEGVENPDGSPIRQMVATHEAQLPDFLDVVPYLSQNIDLYPVFWRTDNHWTAWGCFKAYQMICSRLGIPTNTDLLNYPFSEHEGVMGFGRIARSLQPETVRTYRLDRYSRRVYANQVVRYRENLDLDRLADEMVERANDAGEASASSTASNSPDWLALSRDLAGCRGAHVIYQNPSAEATDKCLVLFGDGNAHYGPHLLTGMLAETVREVHFVWSRSIDYEYIRQVRPDIVISEVDEASMVRVPEDKGALHTLAEDQLQSLQQAVVSVERFGHEIRPDALPGLRSRRTVLLESEIYQLEPPVMVQQGDGGMHQELSMKSYPVSLIDLDRARLYFNGSRCLLRTASGKKVFGYDVDEQREAYLLEQDFQPLPGRSLLLAPTPGAHCYYHWMLDILPKLGLLSRHGISLDSIDHFLVRQITSDFQIETLASLGIDRSRIRETLDSQYLLCENLLHVDMNNGINMKMNRFVPLWLKHHFLSVAAGLPAEAINEQPSQGERSLCDPQALLGGHERLKLYIARPPGVRRGILNEDEIRPMVEAAGFTMVYMEGLSVAQQASLLSRADALMAPHGGALTNMVFCKPGIPVVELLSKHVYPYYYGLASMCGHRYHAILEDPVNDHGRLVNVRIAQKHDEAHGQEDSQNQSFHVDAGAVKAMLDRLSSG